MIEIPLQCVGDALESDGQRVQWTDLPLGEPWLRVIGHLAPESFPSDIQIKTIRDGGLLTSRRNLLIAGPTNSGKSLLAYLALLKVAKTGKRVLLLEPLRAIAQEKYDELESLTEELQKLLGRKIGVSITTGDYRLNEETMQSPPPDEGEIVIATPERIEAILRNPDFDAWIESFRVVCVDEAHLLADAVRGASLEYVVTSFRTLRAAPRLVLLSATLGDVAPLVRWLDPCDAVQSDIRKPPLRRTICQMEPDEDVQAAMIGLVRGILDEPRHSVLIFVYQTSWAGALARNLQAELGELCGTHGAACYHSRMSSGTKATVRRQVQEGSTRCVVSTAALAMGVNLPATHVIVRDLSYGPGEPLPVGALQQMTGRAGRGSRPGHAYLILKRGDSRELHAFRQQLESNQLPTLRSVFLQQAGNGSGKSGEPPLAKTVLSFLARRPDEKLKTSDVENFISHTMNGAEVVNECLPALRWLGGCSNLLAFEDDGVWISTRLGQAAIRGSLPLKMAAGVAQLVRDLLSIDEKDEMLLCFSPLDILLLTELMTTRPVLRKPFSEAMATQVDDWASRDETKSVLFQNWIRGQKGFSKASEILGSLGIEHGGKATTKDETARKFGYQAMLRAIMLWQRAHGALPADLERRWKVGDLDEIQEPWRDDRLFLLGAMRNLWEIRCFFYHLKEDCLAGDERILRVKRALQRMHAMSLRLMNLISWCSPLGPVFLRLRSSMSGSAKSSPAQGTMRRLEEAGITDIASLRACKLEDLIKAGVKKAMAAKIVLFLRRS
jgi:helicase